LKLGLLAVSAAWRSGSHNGEKEREREREREKEREKQKNLPTRSDDDGRVRAGRVAAELREEVHAHLRPRILAVQLAHLPSRAYGASRPVLASALGIGGAHATLTLGCGRRANGRGG